LADVIEKRIPADLDALYSWSLNCIMTAGKATRNLVLELFSWILYIKEPLGPISLIAIITDIPGETRSGIQLTDLVDICFNLIVFDSSCNLLRFAHQSVQDFFLEKEPFQPENAHRILAARCLKLCSVGPPDGENTLVLDPDIGYSYVAAYWAVHYRSAEPDSMADSLVQ
jgi:hypothetical protein